jgi:hypothetical protein
MTIVRIVALFTAGLVVAVGFSTAVYERVDLGLVETPDTELANARDRSSAIDDERGGLMSKVAELPSAASQSEIDTEEFDDENEVGEGSDERDESQITPIEWRRMENELLNFLSQQSGLGITGIPHVQCRGTRCEIQITGLTEERIVQLIRGLRAHDSRPICYISAMPWKYSDFEFTHILLTYCAGASPDGQSVVR